MSTPSDDILNQRRLRAAEIALETARRRRFETDEAVRALQAEVLDMESALSATLAARERDRLEAEADIEAARRAQLLAEQRLVRERERRLELEEVLSGLRRAESQYDALAHELAAEQRIRQLEGELELVSRRAAEFEYGVRMAVFDAFKLVRELAGRVGSVLPDVRLPLPELGRGDPDEGTGMAHAARAASPGPEEVASAIEALDSGRLDAALERLRASTPPPAEAE
jgi:hypothetical protein